MDYANNIWFIPAIKSFSVHGVGVWNQAHVEFGEDLNILRGSCGSGKTTLLLAMRSVFDTNIRSEYLAGHTTSRIEIKLMNDVWYYVPQSESWHNDTSYRFLSAGEQAFNVMKQALQALPDRYCIVMDSYPFDYMQEEVYERALSVLKTVPGQKIVATTRKSDISGARIFECIYDITAQSSSIIIQGR